MKNTEHMLLLALAVVCLSGCVDVAPWERGILAKQQMSLDPYPMQSTLRGHIYDSREAGASGHAAGGGGGCGCY